MRTLLVVCSAIVLMGCNGGPDAPSATTQITLVADSGTWVDCLASGSCRLQITARNSGPACAVGARALIRFRNAEGGAIGDYPAELVRDGYVSILNPGELHLYRTGWLPQPPTGATYTASFSWTAAAC